MKKKLPSYSLEKALKIVSPCHPYYTLEVVKKMFPGKEMITARDVLKVPARRFRHGIGSLSPSENKCFAVEELLPTGTVYYW